MGNLPSNDAGLRDEVRSHSIPMAGNPNLLTLASHG
jgi:hypothetical protein